MTVNYLVSQFIMITDIKTVIFLVLPGVLFYIIRILKNKNIKFSIVTIYSTLMGISLGILIKFLDKFFYNDIWIYEITKWYSLFWLGFLEVLKIISVPAVFISALNSIVSISNDKNIRKITVNTIIILFITCIAGTVISVGTAGFMNIKSSYDLSYTSYNSECLIDVLLSILSINFINKVSFSNIIFIILCAVIFGGAVRLQSNNIFKSMAEGIGHFYKIMTDIVTSIIKLKPYAFLTMAADVVIRLNMETVILTVKFILSVYISIFFMFLFHLIIIGLNGINMFYYIKNSYRQLKFAFFSRSSGETLPLTIKTLIEKYNINENTAKISAGIGTFAGMNGCAAIYPALMVFFALNITGFSMDFSFYFLLIIQISLVAVMISGVPGTAIITATISLLGAGLFDYYPVLTPILIIDPVLDMGRTMINVNGANAAVIYSGKAET